MAWAYRKPGDPNSGQYWVNEDDPNAVPDTTPTDPAPTDPIDDTTRDLPKPVDYTAREPTPTPTTYDQWGSNPYVGWDQNKIQAGHDSPKYQIGQVLSNFDPHQGVTPDVLAALNQLGLGEFYGSGDSLQIRNADPRFEGYTNFDIVRGYGGGTGPDATWNYGIIDPRDQGGATAPPSTDYGQDTRTDYGGGGAHDNTPADPGQNPFASLPQGGVWIPSLGQWVPGDHPLAQTPGAVNVGSGTYVPGQPGSSSSSGGSTLTNPDQEIQGEARQQILNLLRSPKLSPEDLRNSPEMQAVQLQAQRAQERDRAALAERAAAEGWSGSGGFEGGLTALREKQGATEMQFMGQLALEYMERQREDVQRGIEFALNQGQFDQAQSLQRELAALEAAIEREKIAANVGMNDADNALERELGLGDQELRRLLGMSDLELRRYLGQINSSFDFADLDFRKNKDILDRGAPPEL